jgi:hypothetical protein
LVLWGLVAAGVLHVGEEFVLPGGFMRSLHAAAPRFANWATPAFALIINVLSFVVLAVAALIGTRMPLLSLSTAALCFSNAWLHVGGAIKQRVYVPGLVTAVALYLPISTLAYAAYGNDGYLSIGVVAGSIALGLLFEAVPPAYFVLRAVAAGQPLVQRGQKPQTS